MVQELFYVVILFCSYKHYFLSAISGPYVYYIDVMIVSTVVIFIYTYASNIL